MSLLDFLRGNHKQAPQAQAPKQAVHYEDNSWQMGNKALPGFDQAQPNSAVTQPFYQNAVANLGRSPQAPSPQAPQVMGAPYTGDRRGGFQGGDYAMPAGFNNWNQPNGGMVGGYHQPLSPQLQRMAAGYALTNGGMYDNVDPMIYGYAPDDSTNTYNPFR